MKKQFRQKASVFLSTIMLLGVVGGCGNSGDTPRESSGESTGASVSQSTSNYPIQPEELGSGTVKWSEDKTSDGWMKVTNEGGEILGYSPDSGVKLIQVDGLAFKDLNGSGSLDLYEDWRQPDKERAVDLASKMSGEEIVPLMTHGGWSSFASSIEGDDLEYIKKGGRSGTSRSAAANGNTAMAVTWTNAIQTLAEATGDYGIPIAISVDPVTVSGMIGQTALAATMDMDLIHEIASGISKQYRAVGITMLLGPQIDLTTTPIWFRASGTYSEDPALSRDIAATYINALQSTYDEAGNDLGWGKDSVFSIVKHFVATGASEGGRDDHGEPGKYMVFPGGAYDAHLIPFFDGAFNLSGATEVAGGLMPSYGIPYSEDGSLGEFVANAYNEKTLNLLRNNGYDGFILTDWGITVDGRTFGVDDMTVPERFAALFKLGNDQIGGTSDIENAIAGYKLLVQDMGEDAALALVRESARRFFSFEMGVGLFENPYISKDAAVSTVYTEESNAFGRETQEKSIVMLKNTDNLIRKYDTAVEKPTVYLPYVYQTSGSRRLGYTWSCKPSVDIEIASQYYNVVTDSAGEPSGTDAKGEPMYLAEDIIRASAEEIATCDFAIVSMLAPFVQSAYDAETNTWYPASIQYEQYTANSSSVRKESIAGDMVMQEIDTGHYGKVTQEVKENRSYYGNTAALPNSYSDYETLRYVDGVIPENCKTIVLMRTQAPLVWSEVEPMADAILLYFNGYEGAVYDPAWFDDAALMNVITGQVEPSALLPFQQPASMEAAEAQFEDVPRDMECYKDANGNTYDFVFGLNWSGTISDARTTKYGVPTLVSPTTTLSK